MEIFEDRPDDYMVRQVIWKTYTFLDELAYARWSAPSAGGVGTVLRDETTPPGDTPRALTMTVTGFEVTSDYDTWYSADAVFDTWSGDGSSPYMELSGTAAYTQRLTVDGTRVLSGSLDVDNPPDDNTIDHIEFDLTFNENRATGTVTADGTTIALNDLFIPTE